MILDDYKGYAIIPFVLYTVIYDVKTAQTQTESGNYYQVRNNEL